MSDDLKPTPPEPNPFRPKTRPTRADLIRVGDIVLESYEHPATVTSVHQTGATGQVYLRCRYIWQRPVEPDWSLGKFAPATPILKAVK
ncbi:hypothetical protein ITJ66_07250 [Plantibacter sp. VKM Ac-2885]|uniref:hypothetical protein n=1 Tax=Plantibacter sp. VKM Ac-2885 TaxID=2783828 RepID=UPI00188BC716|nr:hypothetical protein [Plantibacter sp. VKM Ac-2885]MBF4512284.1 hypothetical protein [Plantibacter sp. VKM Ac-2885]